ncbi:MAG: VCBS repeat-containing protein [Verrucomicrobiales bacterium]|nr:VCBS repeat-containing protein [Verrucomicrobiales bacterium]
MPLLPTSIVAFLGLFLFLAGAAVSANAEGWEPGVGFRRRAVTPDATQSRAGFVTVNAPTAGIHFTNRLDDERSLTNQIFLNGSGVAAGDIDGDGLCDLYFCGLDSPNALYRNFGNWRFEPVTTTGGIACADQASTGAAFADVDGDGDLDLLVNGIARGIRLFFNDGHGGFREATDSAGLRSQRGGASLALADIDGDGWLDLYVVNYRSDTMRDMPDLRFRMGVTNGMSQLLSVNGRPPTDPELEGRFTFDQNNGVLENGEPDDWFLNRGNGRFERLDWNGGRFLDEQGKPMSVPYDWGLSAMFHDLNGDGAPELYVCNDFQSPDRLWINDGHGRFRAAPTSTLRHTCLFSMGVDFADIDRDGHDDFFVADMLSREHERRQVQVMDAMAFGQFRRSTSDRPQFPRNMLFHNRGDGTFAEIAQEAGVDASDWTWCPVFLDVDLDGFEDLLTVTGHWRDAQHADLSREIEEAKTRQRLSPREQLRLRRRFPRLDTPNFAFRNRGDGRFEEVGAAWGFDAKAVSQGIALADLDNDGDLDVVINTLNDAPILCRNTATSGRIAVRLRGVSPNTQGIGARIRVTAPGLPRQGQEILCGGRYLSGDEALRVFATGTAREGLTLEVLWRDGRRSVLTNASPNYLYEIDQTNATSPLPPGERPDEGHRSPLPPGEGQGEGLRSPLPPGEGQGEGQIPPTKARATAEVDPGSNANASPAFVDVSSSLDHRHVDEPFDDFARQPLLPHALSQWGPGITWFDFNQDGWDDLLVGAGKGGRLGVFRNDGRGGFVRQKSAFFETPSPQDFATLLGYTGPNGQRSLLLGFADDDAAASSNATVNVLSLVDGTSRTLQWPGGSATGPMAMADLDRDGDLDLFVGGRQTAGRYPQSTPSAVFRNDQGVFIFDAERSRQVATVNLAQGATFSDQDGDGWPDLVVTCEWGAIQIFRNTAQGLQRWNPAVRASAQGVSAFSGIDHLDQLTGWWTGIAAGDLDNDGRLDLVAGNWGRNTSRHPDAAHPIELHFGDAEGLGRLALLETWQDPLTQRKWPARDWSALSLGFPSIREKFPTFAALSVADAPSILACLPPTQSVRAATLDTVLLLNRGDHYELSPLPAEAQRSPVFGVAIGDLDGDGNEDVVLSQNFAGVAPIESRHDSGLGVWLRGDGKGALTAVHPNASGLRVDGDGRGVAVTDYDHDGRLDISFGQHGGTTRLYRNATARPARRVVLEGAPQNPAAIGATARAVIRGNPSGPRHEISLGSGFSSQNGLTLLLPENTDTEAVEVRWPGAETERRALPAGHNPVVFRLADRPGRP